MTVASSEYCLLLSLLVFLLFITDTRAVLDFTCLSFSPRIQKTGDNNHFLGGFTSGNATGAEVNFGRTLDTGTGRGLPLGAFVRGHGSTAAKLIQMPQSGGKSRVGVFYCEADTGNGEVERTNSITMTFSSDITPLDTFQTVNLGESVVFEVEKTLNVSALRWRHNGGSIIPEWNGKEAVYIDRAMVTDAGLYECYWDGQHGTGDHAIFQLIVRECIANKWGPPECSYDCFLCLNGGVCDDRSGKCVCSPGFTGSNCEQVLGSNRWAQDGSLMCSRLNGNDPHSRACQGTLFCLPYPYGCSCAARYYGIDCIKDCPDGFYGANCKSKCNCPPGISCLDDTGECKVNGARCADGFSGINCQQQCSDPTTVTDVTINPLRANGFYLDWEPEGSPCIHKQYLVEYEQTSLDQCDTAPGGMIKQAGVVKSSNFTIQGLDYYSTYIFFVTTILNGSFSGERSLGVTVSTGERAPASAPPDVTATFVTPKSISFQWSEVPCGSRRGEVLAYLYFITDERRQELISNATTETVSATVRDLSPFTQYRFELAAITKEGIGPLSSPIYMTTNQTAPGAPLLLTVAEVGKYSISVTWQEPVHPHYIVEKYFVSSKVVRKPYDLKFRKDSEPEHGQLIYNTENYTFENLKPTTEYQLKVIAYSGGGKGEHADLYQFTLPATSEDMSIPQQLSVIEGYQVTDTTVSISIPRSISEFVTGYQVGVEWIPGSSRRRRQSGSGHYLDPRFHVAGEIPKSDVNKNPEFIIGDNKTYGMFYNGPLMKEQTYKIYTAFVSRTDTASFASSWSDGRSVVTSWSGGTHNRHTLEKNIDGEQEGYNKDQKVIIVLIVIIVLLVIAFVGYALRTSPPGTMNKMVVRWNKLT